MCHGVLDDFTERHYQPAISNTCNFSTMATRLLIKRPFSCKVNPEEMWNNGTRDWSLVWTHVWDFFVSLFSFLIAYIVRLGIFGNFGNRFYGEKHKL